MLLNMKNPFEKKAPPRTRVATEHTAGATHQATVTRQSKRAFSKVLGEVVKANAVNMALVALVTVVAAIFIIAVSQEYIGNFTINLDRLDMYRRGISMSETADFSKPQNRLRSDPVENTTNISIHDLPPNLQKIDGRHNGENYIAYTFYVKNGGKEMFDYKYAINVDAKAKNVDTAIRVGVFYNSDVWQVFAKSRLDGSAEVDTIPFAGEDVVDTVTVKDFAVDRVDKFCVVIWLEGDDPDCTDELLGGMVKLSMQIDVLDPQQDKIAV